MLLRQLLPASVLAAGALAGPAVATTTPEELLERLEAHHASLSSLSASFTQTYRSAATAQELVEHGRIFVEKPLVRFDYRKPDRKVFLVEADGTTLAYVPADRSAVRGRLPNEAPHLRLLRGERGLAEDFRVRVVRLTAPVQADSLQLELVPRRPLHDLERVFLELSPDGRRVHRVLVVDALGNESDLVLARLRENVSLPAGTFRLELPRSVSLRDLTEGDRP